MRAVVCRELGPPESLVVEERPVPEPGPGQVRIAVRAAGVNFVDGLIVAGKYQFRAEPPFVPGSEIAGVVDAVGEGVEAPAIGERVFTTVGFGGFADYAVARARDTFTMPDVLDFARAASFSQAYGTALFALRRRIELREGEAVLVLGAAGGVGLAALDTAKAFGARVIAAASSPEKRALCERMGADATIDYTTEDLKVRARELSGGGVDVVYDPVGGPYAEPAFRALRNDGRFLVIGFAAGEIPRLPLNLVLLSNRQAVGVEWGGWAMRHPEENRALLEEVLSLVAAGRLHPVAPEERSLGDAPRTIADLLGRRVTGKVVLVP